MKKIKPKLAPITEDSRHRWKATKANQEMKKRVDDKENLKLLGMIGDEVHEFRGKNAVELYFISQGEYSKSQIRKQKLKDRWYWGFIIVVIVVFIILICMGI